MQNPNDSNNAERKPKKQFVEKAYKRPERRIMRVDFQRVEEAPVNRFEKEIQKEIAKAPSPLDLAVTSEMKESLLLALREAPLTEREKICIEKTLEGFTSTEIAREIGIRPASVLITLRQASHKIGRWLKPRRLL